MRTIEITTTQNVTIEYELAAAGDRMVAFIVDFVIMVLASLILFLALELTLPDALKNYIAYITFIPVFLFYSIVSENFGNGRSWGKKVVGIKVVKISGTEPAINDYLIRWTFRMIDIYLSLSALGFLLITSTSKGQRLGDIVANTAVIRLKPRSNLKLSNIMKIASHENHVPKYPEVRQMKEVEMLLVKNVLDRVKNYPNNAHQEVVDELVDILRSRLNIKEQIEDQQQFLRALLLDYVALTR